MTSRSPLSNTPACSAEALRLMRVNGIEPSPRNYGLWFHYVEAGSSPLQEEMDRIVAERIPFDEGLGSYLHEKYVEPPLPGLEGQPENARAMLADLLRAVGEMSNETEQYNREIDEHIAEIKGKTRLDDVRQLIEAVVASASGLRQSGEDLQQSLSESRAEIDQLKKNLQEATHEAQRDFLTGVFNRKAFDKMMDELMGFAKEQKTPLSVLMIDIDHFKRFNDDFGHLIGDEVLKMVAKLIKETVKGTDVVARFGGEEFAVILPATPVRGAVVVAENIRHAIANKEMRHRDTGESYGSVTVSIGTAGYASGDTIPLLIRRADTALYSSKRDGRNRVTAAAGTAAA